jgi:ribosomal protein L4
MELQCVDDMWKLAIDLRSALHERAEYLEVFGEASEEKVALAVRNLPKVNYVTQDQLSAVDVINAEYVVIAKNVLTKIEEVLQ